MPTKKDLAGLLSENAQQPLRRGRGLRLSRASQQAADASLEVGASSVAPDLAEVPPAEQPPEPAPLLEFTAEPVAAASEPAPITAEPVAPAASDVEPYRQARKKRKLQLRRDLLKQCKQIARKQNRKLYQVIESALEEYIRRHGGRE